MTFNGYDDQLLPRGDIIELCHLRLLQGKTPGTFIVRLTTGRDTEGFSIRGWLIKNGTLNLDVLEDIIAVSLTEIRGELLTRFPYDPVAVVRS